MCDFKTLDSFPLLKPPCSKNAKTLEALLTEIGYVTAGPRYNSRAMCGAHLALRGEILQLHELRRQVRACWVVEGGSCEPP